MMKTILLDPLLVFCFGIVTTNPLVFSFVSPAALNPFISQNNYVLIASTPTGGVAPYSFVDANLSPFDTSSIGSGSPTVFAYDLNGCSAFVNLIIEEPSEIEISNVQCLNSISIEVQNALGNFEIIWTAQIDANNIVTKNTISTLEVDYPAIYTIKRWCNS